MNADNGMVLTEEQVKEVSNVLEDQNKDNPIIKRAREIGQPVEDTLDDELPEDVENAFQEGVGMDLFEASTRSMREDSEFSSSVIKGVSDKFNLDPEEVSQIMDIAKRYRAGEKFSLYGAMPERAQKAINEQILSTGNVPDRHSRSLFTELFIEEFNSEIVDKYLDKSTVEFNKSIAETLGSITNIVDMYAGHIRYMMEVDLKKKAEATDNEAAKAIYLGCSEAFTRSYTYTDIIRALDIYPKARRKLYKDNFQINRYCNEFNHRNQTTKYSIRNVEQLTDSMIEHLGSELNISQADAEAFTILFIKSTMNLDLTKLVDSIYVYYVIFNIVNLGFDTNKSKFYHVVVNNIKKVFNAMWEKCGKSRRFEIEDDVDWVEDEPTEDEIKDFTDTLSEGLDTGENNDGE